MLFGFSKYNPDLGSNKGGLPLLSLKSNFKSTGAVIGESTGKKWFSGIGFKTYALTDLGVFVLVTTAIKQAVTLVKTAKFMKPFILTINYLKVF
jgi:hypothetical protein